MARTRRKNRATRWLIIGGVLAMIAAGAGVTAALTHTKTTDTGSPAPVGPTSTSSPSSTGAAGANGCLYGPDITAQQVLDLQAKKNFTPTGAVEFMGALDQFVDAADPLPRAGFVNVLNQTTAGAFKSQVAKLSPTTSPYKDSDTHAGSLAGGVYYVESASASQVVVTVFEEQMKNGAPDTNAAGQVYYGGGTYTLVPTSHGWVITTETAGRDYAQTVSVGSHFRGGC